MVTGMVFNIMSGVVLFFGVLQCVDVCGCWILGLGVQVFLWSWSCVGCGRGCIEIVLDLVGGGQIVSRWLESYLLGPVRVGVHVRE